MEEEQYSIPAMATTDSLLSQHQFFQKYYTSPTINNTAADTQMSDINYDGLISTLDVDVDYEVQDYNQEDNDFELLSALINNHVANKEDEEEIVLPCQAAVDDVSSWGWPRFGGTLESIIDQAPCLVPPIIQHVPDHGVHDHHGNKVEEEEEKDDHQREGWKITKKRQGKASTTISSSTNKRIKATILHNKSERKRRGKINDRLETLQNLVPNFNKHTDKASMLDQVIEYVKKLQTQKDQMMKMRFGMFDNNNMAVAVHPMMMMPHNITTMQAMQQQQQEMSMMTQMGIGMSMNPAGLVMMPTGSIVHPNMRQE